MAEDFITYATNNGVSKEAAEALASSCMTISQLNAIISRYAAHLNVENNEFLLRDGTTVMESLGMHVRDPANANPAYWESPALIDGKPLTWREAYSTVLKDVPTWQGEPLDLGEAMRTEHSAARDLSTTLGLPTRTNLLNWQGNRALSGELPVCEMLLSGLGEISPSTPLCAALAESRIQKG